MAFLVLCGLVLFSSFFERQKTISDQNVSRVLAKSEGKGKSNRPRLQWVGSKLWTVHACFSYPQDISCFSRSKGNRTCWLALFCYPCWPTSLWASSEGFWAWACHERTMHKRTSGWPWITLMLWSCLTGASEKSTRVAPCRLAWASESALLQGFGRSMGLRHRVGHDDGKGWIGDHFNGDPADDRVLFFHDIQYFHIFLIQHIHHVHGYSWC